VDGGGRAGPDLAGACTEALEAVVDGGIPIACRRDGAVRLGQEDLIGGTAGVRVIGPAGLEVWSDRFTWRTSPPGIRAGVCWAGRRANRSAVIAPNGPGWLVVAEVGEDRGHVLGVGEEPDDVEVVRSHEGEPAAGEPFDSPDAKPWDVTPFADSW